MAMISPRFWIVSLFPVTRSPLPISHFLFSLSSIPETTTFNPHWIIHRLHHRTKRVCRQVLPPRHPTLCSLVMVRNYHHFSLKEHHIYLTGPVHQKTSSRLRHNVEIVWPHRLKITPTCFPQIHQSHHDTRYHDVLQATLLGFMTTIHLCTCPRSTRTP